MGLKNGKGRGSAPVCWDCKASIPLDSPWRRFAPEVVLPPSGVIVCGSSCPKTPPGSVVFHAKELLSVRTP